MVLHTLHNHTTIVEYSWTASVWTIGNITVICFQKLENWRHAFILKVIKKTNQLVIKQYTKKNMDSFTKDKTKEFIRRLDLKQCSWKSSATFSTAENKGKILTKKLWIWEIKELIFLKNIKRIEWKEMPHFSKVTWNH